jgi:hypothetical protein
LVHPGRCIGARSCEAAQLPGTDESFHFFTDRLKGGADLTLEDMCSCASTAVNFNGFPILNEQGQSTVNDNCKRCDIRKVMSMANGATSWSYVLNQGVQCTRCKTGFYYNPTSGDCLAKQDAVAKAKDSGFVTYNTDPNRAEIEPPFQCIKNVKSTSGKKCKCPKEMRQNNVVACEFSVNSLGVTDISVTGCEDAKYLSGTSCVDKCPAGLVHYGARTAFRSCETTSFVCDNGLPLVNGRACECPHKDTAACKWHVGNTPPLVPPSSLAAVHFTNFRSSAKLQKSVSSIVSCKGSKQVATKVTVTVDDLEEKCVNV